MKERIQELARQYYPNSIEQRRYLHQHPELSFEEVQTGRYIAARLQELGIEHRHGVAENGVVALIKGRNPK